ncbi:hypothetical protein PZ895_14400 [Mesorhizobium sp. YIM 152430]|uniref:hypothetical protein n=1 Tax=Mesorhizobium sp. YIM 152430 TaxID=3031761 RepID=UPI0023DA4E80|nr:hypothetical protein [Mesorhizobium sp. YIM 152430]MDF1600950.1 hypothetical protein [Mesorhizobium sp. YIM 152430]
MAFDDGVIRRLRDRLLLYRSATRQGGRKRQWEAIARDIVDADSVPHAFYERETSFKALGEALRRFAAGKQVLTEERAEALAAFLREKRYLTDADLEESDAPVQALLGLSAFFGRDGQDDKAFDPVCGAYVALSTGTTGRQEVRLLRIARHDGQGWTAEETVHLTAGTAPAHDPVALNRFLRVASRATIFHDGWLVPSAPDQAALLVRSRETGQSSLRTLARADGHGLYVIEHDGLGAAPTVTMDNKVQEPAPAQAVLAAWVARHGWHFTRQEER